MNLFFSSNKFFLFLFYSPLKIGLLFSVIFALHYKSQSYTVFELDSITKNYKYNGQYEDAIDFNMDVLKRYKKNKDYKGIAAANINIGNLLASINEYSRSLDHLNIAKNELTKINDPILYSKLYNEYGRDYFLLRLFKQSNEKLNESIKYSLNVTDRKMRMRLLYHNYLWKWSNFDELNEIDSLYKIQSSLLKLNPEPLAYIKIAKRFMRQEKDLDSAEYYLKKSNKILTLSNRFPLHHKAQALMSFGQLYYIKKEYENALNYYLSSLTISRKIKRQEYIMHIYKEMSKIYEVLDDKQNSHDYYEKYSFLNDSINDKEKVALYSIVDELGDKKEENKLYFFIVVLVIIVILYIGYKIRENKKNKNTLLPNTSFENIELKRIHEYRSYSEIIKMAEDGSPFFLSSFKKLYPDFHEKLKFYCSDLTEHDIKFCTYLRLNLDSKQILQYENITLRAIETKKYRLKKKLGLSSDVKLSTWILEL